MFMGLQSPVSGDVVAAFSDMGSAAGLPPGTLARVGGSITIGGTPGGACGTSWVVQDSLWRPACGQVLWHLAAQADGVANGTTVEQILASPQFPPGVFAGCRAIALRSVLTASASDPNNRISRWRVGPDGALTDAATVMVTSTGARRIFYTPQLLTPAGLTGLQPSYAANDTASIDTPAAVSLALASPVTVPNMINTALYVSITVQQGASPASQVGLVRAWIYVE